MTKKTTLLAIAALLITVAPVTAQPASGEGDGLLALRAYWIANFGTGGNAMIGVSAAGAIDTVITLSGANSPDSVCMGADNDLLLVSDTTGVWSQPLSGVPAPKFTSLPGSDISWLDVDEDGGFVYCTSSGEIYHSPALGVTPTLVRKDGGMQWNTICWDGGTGNYMVGHFGGGLHAICRDGSCIASHGPTLGPISGVDWDPLYDQFAVSRFGAGYLAAVNRWGTASSLGPAISFMDTANSVEVVKNPQPLLGVPMVAGDRYIGGEYGSAPNHIYGKKRNNTTAAVAYLASNSIGPADVEAMWSRQVWGLNAARAGGSLRLSVYFPLHGGESYVLAASLGHAPGINLGGLGTIYLNPDPLFYISAASVAAPFANFVGVLNGTGRATNQPVITLPGAPGLRFYVAGITLKGNAITEVSNCYGVTIQS